MKSEFRTPITYAIVNKSDKNYRWGQFTSKGDAREYLTRLRNNECISDEMKRQLRLTTIRKPC